MYKQYLFTIFDWFVLLPMNFLKNKFELDFTFSKIGWSYFKYLETTSKGPYICMFFPCLYVKILDGTSPPKLLNGFTSNFQELLLRIPIFAWYSVVRLSVCLSVKKLDRHLLPNYWMDLLQIFRNYFLRSLYLHVLPLSVCLSVKILE